MTVTTRVLTGRSLYDAIRDVARLRVSVLREWPYLYEGNLDYECDYLKAYLAPGAVVVTAQVGNRIVGASMGTPLHHHENDLGDALAGRPEPVSDIFFCAASLLLPGYRGYGLGGAFFDAVEAHARDLGFRYATICTVVRPDDHPARPADYRSVSSMWKKRGYRRLTDVVAHYAWKDRGEEEESLKALQYWMRTL